MLQCCVLQQCTVHIAGQSKLFPYFIKQILDRRPITLDGDGSNSRDFVYVEDVARAIELALYADDKNVKTRGEIINIGSGKETKFNSLINLIIHTIGLKKLLNR